MTSGSRPLHVLVLYSLLIGSPSNVCGTKETCSRGCGLPPKSGLVVVGTGTYSKSIGRQCPSETAMIRHFVDPTVDNTDDMVKIDADMQNEVDRAPFNLENTMVEFQSCRFDEPESFDLRDYDFSDMYKHVKRSNTTENLRRVKNQLVPVDDTGGVVSTSTNFGRYRVTKMEEITDLPDPITTENKLKHNAITIRPQDWMVTDNVTGSVAESTVFDSARRKDGYYELNFTGLNVTKNNYTRIAAGNEYNKLVRRVCMCLPYALVEDASSSKPHPSPICFDLSASRFSGANI